MRIAIIGSAQTRYHDARIALDAIEPQFFDATYDRQEIGTFLRGGVHTYAGDFARARGWSLTRFHSAQALSRWQPDLAIILWDGHSAGCQAVLDHLTNRRVLCWTFLLHGSRAPDALGSNAHLLDPPADGDLIIFGQPVTKTRDDTERVWADAT